MLTALGVLHWSIGDYTNARQHLTDALQLHRTATTLCRLGTVHMENGHLTDALELFTEALTLSHDPLARATGFGLREAQALTILARARHLAGQPEHAKATATHALALHLDAGNLLGQAKTHDILAALTGEPLIAGHHRQTARQIHDRLTTSTPSR